MASNSTQYTVQVQVVGDEALRKLQTQMASLKTSSEKISASSNGLKQTGGAFKNMGHQVQNASYQLTDFIVQVQGGTSASRAFSQQAPQLLGAFGALGAALGIVAAVAPAVFQLFTGGSATIKDAAEAVTAFADASNRANTGIDDLSDTYGRYAESMYPILDLQRKLFEVQAVKDMQLAMEELSVSVGFFEGGLGKFIGNTQKFEQFAHVVGISDKFATDLMFSLEDLKGAKGFEEQARQAQDLLDFLSMIAPLSSESADSLVRLYQQLSDIVDAATRGAAATDNGAEAQRKMTAATLAQVSTNTELSTQVGILEQQAAAMEAGATAAEAAAAATRSLALATALAKANEDGIISPEEQSALWDYEELLDRQAAARDRITVATKAQSDATRASAKATSDAAREAAKLAREQKRLEEKMIAAADAIDNRFGKAIEDGIINAASGASDAFSNMAKSILEDIARMYIKARIVGPLMQALGLGGRFTSAGLGTSARGNYFPDGITGRPLTAFSTGGIIGGRSVVGSNLMGENGPEAVVPLRRHNGRMGVDASPVNVNVINNGNNEVKVSESTGNDGSRTIDIMIEQKVRNAFATGGMDKIMQSRFGSRPVGA